MPIERNKTKAVKNNIISVLTPPLEIALLLPFCWWSNKNRKTITQLNNAISSLCLCCTRIESIRIEARIERNNNVSNQKRRRRTNEFFATYLCAQRQTYTHVFILYIDIYKKRNFVGSECNPRCPM